MTKRIVLLGLLSLFLFMPCGSLLRAQQRMMADVTTRQAYKKKSLRTERSIFFSSNGSLVVHYTYPQEYYMVSNSLGETAIYQPAANEVTMLNDKTISEQSEMFLYFLSADISDLNLKKLGFIEKETKRDGQRIVRTYVPTSVEDKIYSKVVVACEGRKPIYSAFYDSGGKVVKKNYFSKYVDLPMVTFPTKVTQISYDAQGDSTIRREEYKNIKTNDFPTDAPFDFKIPKDAKRVKPF